MATQRVILTYKDHEALPNDGRRYEIHEGELAATLAPTPRHQRTSRGFFVALHLHVQAESLGEVLYAPIDVILSDTTIVQPDIVYLDTTRLPSVTPRGIEGPPTLVVEIVSPSTTKFDHGTKLQLYARYGVPYYWIVDPDARTVGAYVFREGAYAAAARGAGSQSVSLPPFDDLALDLASIWP